MESGREPREVGNGVLSALHEKRSKKKQYEKEAVRRKKKQYEGKLCSPQALSEETDAPELGVYVLQISTANGRFGSVPAREMQCLFVNHRLLTHCFGSVPARKCSVCSLTIVCSLKLSFTAG